MRTDIAGRLDHFTDRRDELAAYDALWEPTGHRRVLCFGGMSGIGKSTLLEYIEQRHQPHRSAVLIDLADVRLQGGYMFVTTLAQHSRQLFPALAWRKFDRAEAAADDQGDKLRAMQPHVSIQQEQSARGRDSTISESPQTVIVDSTSLTAEVTRRVIEHEERSRTRLLGVLCSVLADAQPFAVLIDTYEVVAHAADQQFRNWFDYEFVTAMEGRMPLARLVVAGREGFPDRLRRATIERWNLHDSDVFLERQRLSDPELVRAIFEHCAGHPLVTGLAVDVWKSGLLSGDPLQPDQLRDATNEQAATRWLMEQLYRRLPTGLEDIVQIAVRLQSYQPELVNHLLANPGDVRLDDRSMATLAALSLTEQLPRGGLRAHDLIREVEDTRFRAWPEAYRSFHRRASDYCAEVGDINGSLYHGIAADEETFADLWLETIEHHRLGQRRSEVEVLISLLEAPERRPHLQPRTVGFLRLEQGMLAYTRADSDVIADLPARERRRQAAALFGEARESFEQADFAWGVAAASHGLGDVQVRTDQLAEAKASYTTALSLYQQIKDRLGEANTLRALGDLQSRTDQLADAEATYTVALGLFRQIEHRRGEANTVKSLGDLQLRTDQLAEAETTYTTALSLYQQIKDRLGEANALRALGELQFRTDQLADAETTYTTALDLFRQIGDRLGEANTLRALGKLQLRTDRLADAETTYTTALALFRHIENRLGEASTLRALGDLQSRTDQLADAETTYYAALNISRQVMDRLGEANALKALGDLQLRTDQLADAETTYTTALNLFRQIEGRQGEASTLQSLGDLQLRTAQLSEAETTYTTALDLFRHIEDRLGEANVRQSLGDLQLRTGRPADAEVFYATALDLFRQIGDRLGEANTLRALGNLQSRTTRLADAEATYTAAFNLYRQIEERVGEADALRALGDLQFRTGRPPEAEASYATALDLFRQTAGRLGEANTLKSLGDLQAHAGQLADAEASYTTALNLFRQIEGRQGEANTLRALGDLQARAGQLADAEASYTTALNLFRQIEGRQGEANTLRALGELSSLAGADDQAEVSFSAALAIFEGIGDRYSAAATMAYRGRHRMSLHRADGCADWRRALDLAAAADPFLLGQILVITVGSARNLLESGTADSFLAGALPRILEHTDLEGTLSVDQRDSRDTAIASFALIHDLAAIRTSGLPQDDSAASTLLAAARELDEITSSAFGLAALTEEIIAHVTNDTEKERLVSLIMDWMQTTTWEESETFLNEHHEQILTVDGQSVLDALARANPGNQAVAMHVGLLYRAIREGVRTAYTEFRAGRRPPHN